MEKYLLMIWVTLEQERTIREVFTRQDWLYLKHENIGTSYKTDSLKISPETSTCQKSADNITSTPQKVHVEGNENAKNETRDNEKKSQVHEPIQPDVKNTTSLKERLREKLKNKTVQNTYRQLKGDISHFQDKPPSSVSVKQILKKVVQPDCDHAIKEKVESHAKSNFETTDNCERTEQHSFESSSSDSRGTKWKNVTSDEKEEVESNLENLSGSLVSGNDCNNSPSSDSEDDVEISSTSGDSVATSPTNKDILSTSKSANDKGEKNKHLTDKGDSGRSSKHSTTRNKLSLKKKREEEKSEEIKCLIETIIKEGKVDIDINCEDGKMLCPYCSREYTNRFNFLRHVQRHTRNAFDCPDCGRTFNNGRNLHAHRFNRSANKIFQCDICDFAGNSACLLRWHKKHQHQPEKEFQCHLCAKVIKTKSYFNAHMKSVHNIDENYPYECHICGEKFMRQINCKRHLEGHKKSNELVKCLDCGKMFKSKKLLSNHNRYHRDRKFLCDHCGKGFQTKTKLSWHYRTHTGDKPYMCTVCDYKTAQKGNLTLHMKIHEKKKVTHTDGAEKEQNESCKFDTDNPNMSEIPENPQVCQVQTDPIYSSLPHTANSSQSLGAEGIAHTSLSEHSVAMVNVVYSEMATNDSKQYPMNSGVPTAVSSNNAAIQPSLVDKPDNMSYHLANPCVGNMDISMADGLAHFPQHAGFHGNHVDDMSLRCQSQPGQMIRTDYTEQGANGHIFPNVQMQFNGNVNNLESVYAQHAGHSHQHLQGDYSAQMSGSDYNNCKASLYSNSLNTLDYNEAYQSMYNSGQTEFSKGQNLPNDSHSSESGFTSQTGSAMSVNQPKMVSLEYCKPVYQPTMMQDMTGSEHQGYSMDDGLVYTSYDQTDTTSMMASMDQNCLGFQHLANTGNQLSGLETANVMGVGNIYGEKNVAHDQVDSSEHYSDNQKLNSVFETAMNVL